RELGDDDSHSSSITPATDSQPDRANHGGYTPILGSPSRPRSADRTRSRAGSLATAMRLTWLTSSVGATSTTESNPVTGGSVVHTPASSAPSSTAPSSSMLTTT